MYRYKRASIGPDAAKKDDQVAGSQSGSPAKQLSEAQTAVIGKRRKRRPTGMGTVGREGGGCPL